MVQQPPNPPVNEELREKAEKRVTEKISLLSHLGAYVIVNAFLIVVWALSGAGYPWFLWVMLGWGIGLAFHTFNYFAGKRSDVVKEKMLQKEMEKLQKEQDSS